MKQAELIAPYIDVKHIVVLEMSNIEGLITRLKRRAMIERRLDDFDENILRTRMQIYTDETSQVLKYYLDKVTLTKKLFQPFTLCYQSGLIL
jgi:adenylate kinase family enzyme